MFTDDRICRARIRPPSSRLLAGLTAILLLFAGLPATAAEKERSSASSLAQLPPDPLDFSRQFAEKLAAIGQVSPDEFARRHPAPPVLRGLDWDPAGARYWDLIQADPASYRPNPGPAAHFGPRMDFRLNPEELDLFHKNGFVVSERLGARSFGDLFYWIYSRDLPVFISSDAILHAWHRSYDDLLKEIEESSLAPTLQRILAGMAEALAQSKGRYPAVLRPSVGDADLFLAVGQSLLSGATVPCVLQDDGRLGSVLGAVGELRTARISLFGRPRDEDFSQYKPRGHYTKSETLRRYFQATMWCGRTDLRVAGAGGEGSPRELGTALILRDLIVRSGRIDEWRAYDALLQGLVGRADSMTFDRLGEILDQASLRFPRDFADGKSLENLQASIVAFGAGKQAIRSHLYASSPDGPDQAELPVSFTVLGQRFIPDSWALAKVVADEIFWDGKKVQRRVPSGLDVAFAVLGNNQAVPMLVERMTTASGRKFRDGLNYQHNLAAVRAVFDDRPIDFWDESLYNLWLRCLRELSAPTTDATFPDAMRTRAWAEKTLNTQLASWTELRHDTILYAKQSSSMMASCDYPAGYVEPRPEFWRSFQQMAERGARLMEEISLPGDSTASPVRNGSGRVAFLRNFATQLSILTGIAEKELAQQVLSQEETRFLRDVVEIEESSGPARFRGWYPGLFYGKPGDCREYDALIADVHTDPDSRFPVDSGQGVEVDPGCIVEEGVGRVDLLVGAFNCGLDRAVYLGPVLSHYEFESPVDTRLNDEEWKETLSKGSAPARPDWTRSYLIPGIPGPGR
jgi:hypothetical protein